MNESSRTPGEREPYTLEEHAVDVNWSIELTDWAISSVEDRVSALEEIIAARWPRSMFLRRRLARQLRESAATYAWVAPDFAGRRIEAVGEELPQRET